MTNTTKPELKPCPFCGGEASLSDAQCGMDGLSMVCRNPRCGSCGADLGYCSDSEAATKAWNTRAPQWQDIDGEMPRPGQVVDVLLNGKSRIPDVEFDGEFWLDDFGNDVVGNWDNMNQITHWMHRPKPPSDV